MSNTDAADWARAQAGDLQGLKALFDRHEQRLFRHACRLLTSREDAKDAVAIAFFELWRRRGSVRVVDGSPLPWLLSTVSNSARNLERSARRYQRVLYRVPDLEAVPEVVPHDESGILAALRKLPEREQRVLTLTVLEGYSERETAQALGVPAGTVKSRLARAKTRLRTEMEGWV